MNSRSNQLISLLVKLLIDNMFIDILSLNHLKFFGSLVVLSNSSTIFCFACLSKRSKTLQSLNVTTKQPKDHKRPELSHGIFYVQRRPNTHIINSSNLSLFFLLISNPTNRLHSHQFLGTRTTEANKSLNTDANGAHL